MSRDHPAIRSVLVVAKLGPREGTRIAAELGEWLTRRGVEVHFDAETGLLLRIGQLKRGCQVIERQRSTVFLHQAEDELAARDRIGVLLGLAGLVRVTVPLGAAGSTFGQKGNFSV